MQIITENGVDDIKEGIIECPVAAVQNMGVDAMKRGSPGVWSQYYITEHGG